MPRPFPLPHPRISPRFARPIAGSDGPRTEKERARFSGVFCRWPRSPVTWAYALVRQLFFGVPLAQGPLSVVALVAGAAAIPLLRHAWQDMRQGRFTSLFPFLAATCVLAIFVGEALTALEVIWILRIGLLLEDYVADKSRKAIREILLVAEKNTFVWIDGVEVETPVDQVRIGDTVVLHTGEKIPGGRDQS